MLPRTLALKEVKAGVQELLSKASLLSVKKKILTAAAARRRLRPWGFQGLFVALSIGFFGGIVGVAARFNNKSSSAWSFGVPLATLMSFLASLLEGCLLVGIFLTFSRLSSMHRASQLESSMKHRSSGRGFSRYAQAAWPRHTMLVYTVNVGEPGNSRKVLTQCFISD